MSTVEWSDWSCTVAVTTERETDPRVVRQVVADLMADVDLAVSRFRSDSELAAVRRAAGRMVPVSRLTLDLVEVALRAAAETHGAVDPTVGAALAEAGYADDISLVRSAPVGRVRPDVARATWRDVRVDPALRLVGVPRGAELDLGATAKAWTADEAARRLHRTLRTAALVEIGGDLAVAGRPAAPWRVDVAEQRGGPVERVGLGRGGLTTSSTTARRWTTRDGTVAHHVIDPETGAPVDGPWRTATVWAASAVEANTASTAALVLGDRAVGWLAGRGLPARLVDQDGVVTLVGAWPADVQVAA